MNLYTKLQVQTNVLVTGGAGFIGSNFVQTLIQKQEYNVTVLDALTYAGNIENLGNALEKITFIRGNILDEQLLEEVFLSGMFQIVIHFAAESHVDNSLLNPSLFIDTNVKGTQNLLNLSIRHDVKKFLQISTD